MSLLQINTSITFDLADLNKIRGGVCVTPVRLFFAPQGSPHRASRAIGSFEFLYNIRTIEVWLLYMRLCAVKRTRAETDDVIRSRNCCCKNFSLSLSLFCVWNSSELSSARDRAYLPRLYACSRYIYAFSTESRSAIRFFCCYNNLD